MFIAYIFYCLNFIFFLLFTHQPFIHRQWYFVWLVSFWFHCSYVWNEDFKLKIKSHPTSTNRSAADTWLLLLPVILFRADLMSAKEILSGNGELLLFSSSSLLLLLLLCVTADWPAGCVSDEVIGQVLATMTAQSVPYTALYTGLRPSRVSRRFGSSLALFVVFWKYKRNW